MDDNVDADGLLRTQAINDNTRSQLLTLPHMLPMQSSLIQDRSSVVVAGPSSCRCSPFAARFMLSNDMVVDLSASSSHRDHLVDAGDSSEDSSNETGNSSSSSSGNDNGMQNLAVTCPDLERVSTEKIIVCASSTLNKH